MQLWLRNLWSPTIGASQPKGAGILSRPADNVPRGILCMVAASLLFAVSNALAKWLVQIYPVGELMFFRSLSSLVVCSFFILPVTGLAVFQTRRPGQHISRGISQAVSQTLTVLALMLMPLAGATAIGFSAPLWAALFSMFFLGESGTLARWAVLLVGFCGVLIVTAPGADTFQLGAIFALGNAVIYGSVTAAVRGMTATESSNTLLMWQLMVLAICHSFLLVFGFISPSLPHLLLLLLSGAVNALGQYLWTAALHLGPTAAVSPFYYFMLVWAMLIGYIVWGDFPTISLLSGSTIVAGSGILLLFYESARKRV